MSDTKAPDASRRSERSRRAIFDAALALVSEAGYTKTTIEGIAARAGVGKQTIYRWWPSKAAVLLDAFLDLAAQANEALGGDAESEIPDTGDLAADLKYVLRATVDELNNPTYDAPPAPSPPRASSTPNSAPSSWSGSWNLSSSTTYAASRPPRPPGTSTPPSTRASPSNSSSAP